MSLLKAKINLVTHKENKIWFHYFTIGQDLHLIHIDKEN